MRISAGSLRFGIASCALSGAQKGHQTAFGTGTPPPDRAKWSQWAPFVPHKGAVDGTLGKLLEYVPRPTGGIAHILRPGGTRRPRRWLDAAASLTGETENASEIERFIDVRSVVTRRSEPIVF